MKKAPYFEKCPICGVENANEVFYQPRERPDANGKWVDIGGSEFVTCKFGLPECPARGFTLTRENQIKHGESRGWALS